MCIPLIMEFNRLNLYFDAFQHWGAKKSSRNFTLAQSSSCPKLNSNVSDLATLNMPTNLRGYLSFLHYFSV